MEQILNLVEKAQQNMICAYGYEGIRKVMKLKIFIQGLRGVGLETAKNLIVSGTALVCIHDDELVQTTDLGCNFLVKESDIQVKTRSVASITKLQEMNQNCKVIVHQGEIDEQTLLDYDIVVVTDIFQLKNVLRISQICRTANKGFIYSGLLGLYGFVFVDFGKSHEVLDQNGEKIQISIISMVTREKQAIIQCQETYKHHFETGDHVKFREVEGMTELNEQIYEIEKIDSYSFRLKGIDSTEFQEYQTGGIAEQVKVTNTLSFKSLQESLQNPLKSEKQLFNICDSSKIGRDEQLHLGLMSILSWVEDKGQLPQLNSENEVDEFVQYSKKINERNKKQMDKTAFNVEEIGEETFKNIAKFARAQISPLATFWGGIVAQEVLKYTGKFTPLYQWLHYDCFEVLPEQLVVRPLINSRYSDYIAIFGSEFHEKLSSQKVLLVGAGLLGVEYVKLFSLAGMSNSQNDGNLIVADDDLIEVPNLSRSFLFKKNNIGKSKSECACLYGKQINANINLNPLKERVAKESDLHSFDDFWFSNDLIINACNNPKTRLYLNSRSIWYNKPFFESSTFGTKIQSSVILPHLSQNLEDYNQEIEDLEMVEKSVFNFPHKSEQTIQFAQFVFQKFEQDSSEFSKYVSNPCKYIDSINLDFKGRPSQIQQIFESIKELLLLYKSKSYEKCIKFARKQFQELFYNKIRSLLASYPFDLKLDSGLMFWSGLKRSPSPIIFDPSDQTHIDFIISSSNIYARICGIPSHQDRKNIIQTALEVQFEPFDEQAIRNQNQQQDDQEDLAKIKRYSAELKSFHPRNDLPLVHVIQFQKNNPEDFHIDFITSVSNLKARNFRIKEEDKFQVKIKVCRIKPAQISTTAVAAGIISIEIFKYILSKPLNSMRNSFINLAIPLLTLSEPLPPLQEVDKDYDPILLGPVKAIPYAHTKWDKIFIQGPMTISEIKFLLKEKYKINILIIAFDQFPIYNIFEKGFEKREPLDIVDVIETKKGMYLHKKKRFLELDIIAENENQEDVNIPSVIYSIFNDADLHD